MQTVICPQCGTNDLNLLQYDSLMALSPVLAFFVVRCPHCGTRVSITAPIPSALREEVQFAALEVGAGMGQSS